MNCIVGEIENGKIDSAVVTNCFYLHRLLDIYRDCSIDTQIRQQVYRSLIRCVPKKTHIRFVYNFDIHEPILIVFGRHVIEKVSSPMVVYFSTQLTSASALPAET